MPSPRQIAERENDRSNFEEVPYDAEAGTPPGVAPQGPMPKSPAITNPPEPPAPARNLRR